MKNLNEYLINEDIISLPFNEIKYYWIQVNKYESYPSFCKDIKDFEKDIKEHSFFYKTEDKVKDVLEKANNLKENECFKYQVGKNHAGNDCGYIIVGRL